MRLPRVFLNGAVASGEVITLPGAAAHHLGNVLRLTPGMPVLGVAPDGTTWALAWMGSGRARVLGRSPEPWPEPDTRMTLAVAVPRGERMDWLVEKAVELGAASLVPLHTERSPLGGQVHPGRVARWERLAQAAAEQSGRRCIPPVLPPSDLVSSLRDFTGPCLVAHPGGEARPLRELLTAVAGDQPAPTWSPPRAVLVAVGPEGGFTPREVDAAVSAGARLLSLGSRILRVETAAIAALTLVLAGCGALGQPAGG